MVDIIVIRAPTMDSDVAGRSLSAVLPLMLLAFVVYYVLSALYAAYATPLRDIPGPTLAKFSRIWLFKALTKRNLHITNIQWHRKYGPIVRIAPNEYSIDDPQAASILYRARDQLNKISLC